MENHHHEEVTELAISTLEKFAKSQLEGELLDDLRTVGVLGWREQKKGGRREKYMTWMWRGKAGTVTVLT